MADNTSEPDEARLPYLRAVGMSTFPVLAEIAGGTVGGTLGATLGSTFAAGIVAVLDQRDRNAQARAVRMLEAAKLEDLHAWQNDPSRSELLLRSIQASLGALAEERLRGLSAVLRAVDEDDAEVDDALVLVDCLEQLDPVHVRAMHVLAEAGSATDGEEPAGVETSDPTWDTHGITPIVLQPVLRRLEAHGMVYDANRGAFGGPPLAYRLTEAGVECLAYLRRFPENVTTEA